MEQAPQEGPTATVPAGQTAGVARASQLPARGMFVGRGLAMVRVERLVDGLRRGRAGGLLVRGAPGVGKTRLLAEAAAVADVRGVRVARAACLPLTTPLPFDPILELLRLLGEPVRAIDRGSSRELFGIVLERLEQASIVGPLLLCLDDLQWSDSAAIDFVHYCLARLTDVPIAWLLAARSGRSQAARAHRLERDGLIERLQLEPLSRRETGRLVGTLLASAKPSEALLETVFERTRGNPFLCVALLEALPEAQVADADAGDSVSDLVADLVPAPVNDAIEDRALRLTAAGRIALEWAAILPEPFSFDELDAVGGAAVGSAPEELADAGFVVSSGSGRWSFVHSIVRDAAYGRMPERERVRRHSAVADLLADGPLERAAPQLARARRWREAADAYLRLGGAALDRGQGDDAVMLFRHAQEFARTGREDRLARHAQAGQVLALLLADKDDEAKRQGSALRRVLALHGDPAERLTFLTRYARALLFGRDVADVEAAGEALDEAQPLFNQADSLVLAEALEARAFLTLQGPNAVLAIEDAERAAELARSSEEVGVEARALNSLGYAVCRSREASEGIAILEQALRVATIADIPAEIAIARMRLGFMADAVGDLAAAQEHLRAGLEVSGAPPWVATQLQATLGLLLAHIGDLDGALAFGLAAVRQATRVGPRAETRVANHLTYAHLYRGELAAARRLLESHPVPPGSFEYYATCEMWGLLFEEERQPDAALRYFQQGAVVDDIGSLWCVAGVARTAVTNGELEIARSALGRLEELVGRWPVAQWLCDEARGWVAAGDRRTDSAVSEFRAAASACPQAPDAARLRLEAARLASDRDEIRAVIVEFDRMGAARAADRARALARTLGMRPGRRRTSAGVLTAREQETAQLVAIGHTNAEIATSLYLSPRTVERHVSNILTKLGYRSRIQIATDAAAGRLAGATPGNGPVTTG
jgi:DNA-binding CsgD family transcriptional regulator